MQDDLKKQYQLRFSSAQHSRNEVWKILCRGFFQRFISPDAHVLDIGCGWGEFLNNIKANKKFAIDLNEDARRYLEPATDFFLQDCSSPWPVADNSLDVIFTSNFLEHLPSKPHINLTIKEAKRCLKQDGTLICLGPNIKYLPGAYWDFWDHQIPLSDASLAELLRLHDFAIDKCIARFLPYSMANKKPPPLLLVKLYLNLPFAWRILGKQFLLIAKKSN